MIKKKKPQPRTWQGHWMLAPLSSRGAFSPRLLMAWQAFYVAGYISIKAVANKVELINGVLVQPSNIAVELAGLFLALVAALLSLGTLQKIRLDGPPPEPDQYGGTSIKADEATVNGEKVTLSPAPAMEHSQD